MGRDQGVFDHCCAVDEPEQVPKGVGATLAVTSAVNHELPFRTDGPDRSRVFPDPPGASPRTLHTEV